MDFPQDLPRELHGAYRAIGLPWPDIRIDQLERVLEELGDRPEAERVHDYSQMLRSSQDMFFRMMRDIADEHDGDTMRMLRHKDRPCVSTVRDTWAEIIDQVEELHETLQTVAHAIVAERAATIDYLAGPWPAWVADQVGRGIRDEPTAGRGPACDALLRWRDDRYGSRVCVVTGSPASGKTTLLAWFCLSGLPSWSGYPGPEAAVLLRSLSVAQARAELESGLGLESLDDLDRTVLITLGDPQRSLDPDAMLTHLITPLIENPHVRLLLEWPDPAALPCDAFVLDLDDPRCTDREAFAEWYAAQSPHSPFPEWYAAERARSPFTADQVYPSPGLAALAARAKGADPGEGTIAERVTSAWLDGLSPAAWDAARTLALTLGPVGPYTWRLLHCGRRRDDPTEAARGVAEAAASLPLAVAGLPSYTVCLPELKAALDPPFHGHRELVAVMRGWPRCAELSAPDYVSVHLEAHERLAGASITPLPACRPPVEVTRAMMDSLGCEIVRPREFHPALTHGPTRRFMTKVGLPKGGLYGVDKLEPFAEPMTEQWPDDHGELAAISPCPVESLFMIDFMDSWYLFLDGGTGRIYEVHESLEDARLAHDDVASYAYFLYVIRQARASWCGKDAHRDAMYWCADDLILELHTYAPETMASGRDPIWPVALSDYTLLT
ncbi:SUKH-4 family immunity protein [Nonomuraea wenchangensis]